MEDEAVLASGLDLELAAALFGAEVEEELARLPLGFVVADDEFAVEEQRAVAGRTEAESPLARDVGRESRGVLRRSSGYIVSSNGREGSGASERSSPECERDDQTGPKGRRRS